MTTVPAVTSPFTITTGKENQRDRSANIQVYHTMPHEPDEAPLFVRGKAGVYVVPITRPSFIQARERVDPKIGGQWISGQYMIAEGSVLKLSIQKSLPLRRQVCAVFLVTRSAAALREITIPLNLGRDSTQQSVALRGRFDIVEFEEGLLRGGRTNQTHDRWASSFSPMVREQLINVALLEQEETPLPPLQIATVTNDDGKEVKIPRRRRTRAIDV